MLIFSLVGAALLVGIDYFIKFWVVQYLKPIGTFPVIQDVLHFTYHENDGAAFSIFSGHQEFLIGINFYRPFQYFSLSSRSQAQKQTSGHQSLPYFIWWSGKFN